MSTTTTKYSPFERYYLIRDVKNNLYWQKNINYGYNYQNQAVFETRFVEDMRDATPLSWENASQVMARFFDPHVSGGRWKADTTTLSLDRCPQFASDKDMELLKGTTAPLRVLVQVKIDD